MKVKFWNDTEEKVSNRDEAVQLIKGVNGLGGWMNPDDRIVWYNTLDDNLQGRKPSEAVVVNSVGEPTDASAIIIY